MDTTAHGWKIFDDFPILTYTYSFGPGTSNALAVGASPGLAIVSPPYQVPEGVFEDLLPYGPVRALIASNAFHHLGIPEWKARFPEAPVFAPAQSVARVERQTGIRGIRPLSEAAALTGLDVELIDMPYYRTGEVLVRVKSDRGVVWYVTDLILNMQELPDNFFLKMLFRLSGSAPGLRFNKLGPLIMVKDMSALKYWLAGEYDKAPPRWLIATHGDVADLGANPEAARKLFVGR
jgi:hypothetical protein